MTIPPPSWTDIAHKHGVKMLGTLIFEQWGDVKSIGKEAKIMMDGRIAARIDFSPDRSTQAEEGNLFYARKLVKIAKHFGFEGYLMNFEVVIEHPEELLKWLKFLRAELHREVQGAELMWYDSVLQTDGSLKWQSCLNDKNFEFMLACDSFFTDYHWKLPYLQTTLETYDSRVKPVSQEQNDQTGDSQLPSLSSYDIFYGNDCYGRGTYAGGEFNVCEAVREIQKYPFSVAVFGQAFAYECWDSFTEREQV